MAHKYSFQKYDAEKMARALGRDLPISAKHSIEIANSIRGKSVTRAKRILEGIISLKKPIRYTRFNKDLGHKKGIGAGRYPVKTAENILTIVESAESNAKEKGISNPTIIHIAANRASAQWHYGRQRRRKMKRSHIEIVVSAGRDVKAEAKEAKKAVKKEAPKEEKKAE